MNCELWICGTIDSHAAAIHASRALHIILNSEFLILNYIDLLPSFAYHGYRREEARTVSEYNRKEVKNDEVRMSLRLYL